MSDLFQTLCVLRQRAVRERTNHRKPFDVYRSADDEFLKLLRAIKRGKIAVAGYRILKLRVITLDPHNVDRLNIEISTPFGFTFKLTHERLAEFERFVLSSYDDKDMPLREVFRIGGRAYDVSKTELPKPHHEVRGDRYGIIETLEGQDID